MAKKATSSKSSTGGLNSSSDQSNGFVKILILVLVGILSALIGKVVWELAQKLTKPKSSATKPKPDDAVTEPSPQDNAPGSPEVYAMIKSQLPQPLAEFVYRQFLHETAGGTSDLYKKYNNLFGMKQPTQRDTLSIGSTPSGYAQFTNPGDSILDYINEWWTNAAGAPLKSQPIDKLDEFAQTLKDFNYYTDSYLNYYGGLKKWTV